jgi:hypothetical protein
MRFALAIKSQTQKNRVLAKARFLVQFEKISGRQRLGLDVVFSKPALLA